MNSMKNETLIRFSEIKGSWFADSVNRLMDASKKYNPYVDFSVAHEAKISEYYVDRTKFFSLIQVISSIVDGSISLGAQDIALRLEPRGGHLGLIVTCAGCRCHGGSSQCQQLVESLVNAIDGELEVLDGVDEIGIVVRIPTISPQ